VAVSYERGTRRDKAVETVSPHPPAGKQCALKPPRRRLCPPSFALVSKPTPGRVCPSNPLFAGIRDSPLFLKQGSWLRMREED